jgi:hypothetical protein
MHEQSSLMYHMVDSLSPFAKSIGKGKGIDRDSRGELNA